jgi:hypothetical protein
MGYVSDIKLGSEGAGVWAVSVGRRLEGGITITINDIHALGFWGLFSRFWVSFVALLIS